MPVAATASRLLILRRISNERFRGSCCPHPRVLGGRWCKLDNSRLGTTACGRATSPKAGLRETEGNPLGTCRAP